MRHSPVSTASCLLLAGFVLAPRSSADEPAADRLRVLVETDIGGDADDQASFVRFLLYANEWDVEGIIADRSAETFDQDGAREHLGLPAKNGWELAREYLKAYARVHPNLAKHAAGYPSPDDLFERTVPGHNGAEAGVRLIVAAADRDDPRPIWYGNWGSNSGAVSNLKRAFDEIQGERSPAEYRRFVDKFRIVTLDGPRGTKQRHEDVVKLHVETGYPEWENGRWYHRFRPLTERAGGFDVNRDVKRGHGPLAALYTTPKEGDSWCFVYLIPTGLSDPEQPTWGGWGGRYGLRDAPVEGVPPEARRWGSAYYWANLRDEWNGTTSRDNTAARWAAALQNDFRARLDWCVAEGFADANHPPEPRCLGDAGRAILFRDAPAGKPFALDCSGTTDPDGDRMTYRWFVYREPGTFAGDVRIEDEERPRATLFVPADAAGKTIHIVLEVTDDGTPPLTRYRRVVLSGR
ncbi:MAG: nucleoside hydrolase-like domain-containing protein [Planctomycetales bacterium]